MAVEGTEDWVQVSDSGGRWSLVTGKHRDRPFTAHLATDALGDDNVADLLLREGVRHDCSLEDAVLAIAALRGDPWFSCSVLHGGTHVHDYLNPDAEAPVMVLLHPLAGNCNNWIAVSSGLRSCARVVSLDFPGHGLTKSILPRTATTAQSYVNWLDAVLDELGIQNDIHLVGHSIGGRIASHYASAGRRRLCSLTLVAPALRPALEGARGWAAAAAERLSRVPGPNGIRQIAGLIFFDMLVARTPMNQYLLGHALRDALRDQGRHRYSGLRQTLRWLRLEPTDESIDWESIIAKVNVTALLGQQDSYCPADRLAHLGDAGAIVHIVANTGHLLPLEEPDLVNEVLHNQLDMKSK